MARRKYTEQVLAQLRRVTAAERRDIAEELDAHIEDHALALMALGYTEAEADERAEACMGDPVETGRALNAQYRGWWLVLVRRLAQAVCVWAAVLCVLALPSCLAETAENLAARFGADTGRIGLAEVAATEEVDCRLTLGDDVLRVTRVSVGTVARDGETQCVACVAVRAYDCLPWGEVPSTLFASCALETAEARGTAENVSHGAHRAVVYAELFVPVAAEETEVVFCAERFGERVEQRLALPEV